MLRIYHDTVILLSELRPAIERIERRDRDLGRQLRRAATSVVLNLAEGMARRDGHRAERYRTALGSALEVRAALDAATALGYVGPLPPAVLDRVDKVVRTLFNLTR